MTVPHVHDQEHLEDFQYLVRVTPEGLVSLTQEEYGNHRRTSSSTKSGGESVDLAHFTTEINFNYRLWLLTWSPNEPNPEQLEVNYVFEASSYEDALLVYQQQYQMIHGHGPFDEERGPGIRSPQFPQVPVEGLKLLLPPDVLTDKEPNERLFIAILSRDMACTEYFNL